MNELRKILCRGLSGAMALLLAACATATPAGRVAKAPQLYEALPAGHKDAVLQGRMLEGMTPDAVYLAWGRPDRVSCGSRNGTPFELWQFTELQPIYRSGVNVGLGFGYGPWAHGYAGRYYYDPAFLAIDSGPDYVPVPAAVVRFSRNRVTAWERIR